MSNNLGWKPEPHRLCRIESADGEVSPDGVWQILAHSPDGATWWWLMPIDGDAARWAATHPGEVISRCVSVMGKRLGPAHVYAEGGGQR